VFPGILAGLFLNVMIEKSNSALERITIVVAVQDF
jgi:hypothetical protein